VLSGTAAARALDLVERIAEALSAVPETRTAPGAALESGGTGIATFLAAAATATGRPAAADAARRQLEAAIETLAELPMPPSLFRGFTGVAWASQQLWPALYGEDGSEGGDDVDEMLIEALSLPAGIARHGLMDGLVGLGVYGLARPAAPRITELVVTRLAERTRSDPERPGRTWLVAADKVDPATRALFPDGYFSLGMAHGIDAVIAYLGRVCARGLASPTARALLADAVTWLLATRLDDRTVSSLPMALAPGRPAPPARCAWCYGELPAAVALLAAARGAGVPAWEAEALTLARAAATRAPELAGVVDPGLCHGAAGLGHQFLRLHQATGDDTLRAAAAAWLGRAMDYPEPAILADPGYLYGAAGVGLALLTACGAAPPGWDAPLLLDAE
jgi:hypothetical protein